MTRGDLVRKEREIIKRARVDVNVFSRYVLGLKNSDFHCYLNALIDSDRQFLTFDAPVESGKTTTVEIVRPLFMLGRDPFQMMALVSVSPDLPRRSLGVIRQNIQQNERLHRVFPALKLVESTQSHITVERKRSTLKDPSIVGIGIQGAILGRRWTYLITDDILRLDTTTSDTLREKVWQRLIRELLPRLNVNAKHIDIGTPWVTNDARHRLRKLEGYLFLRFDGETGNVHDINGRIIHTFDGGLWPETTTDPITGMQFGLPPERLASLKTRMPGHEYARQIRCISLAGIENVFGEHLDFAIRLGQGIQMSVEIRNDGMRRCWRRPEPSWRRIFSGIDLAIDRKSTADDTAFFTGAYEQSRRHVLELRRGKIEAPDIIRNMIDIVRCYPSHLGFMCETNAAQRYLLDLTREKSILRALGASDDEIDKLRVFPHVTATNKMNETIGVKAMSLEFEQKRWPIPSNHDSSMPALIQEWVDGLRTYDSVAHCDDMVIASWLFWEITRNVGSDESDWGRFGIYVP